MTIDKYRTYIVFCILRLGGHNTSPPLKYLWLPIDQIHCEVGKRQNLKYSKATSLVFFTLFFLWLKCNMCNNIYYGLSINDKKVELINFRFRVTLKMRGSHTNVLLFYGFYFFLSEPYVYVRLNIHVCNINGYSFDISVLCCMLYSITGNKRIRKHILHNHRLQ